MGSQLCSRRIRAFSRESTCRSWPIAGFQCSRVFHTRGNLCAAITGVNRHVMTGEKRRKTKPSDDARGGSRTTFVGSSAVTSAFIEWRGLLKKLLSRFLPVPQDIEDVVQETYLRAYLAEQHDTIHHPKAFLFRIAKNLALTRLSQKSRQITDYIEEAGDEVIAETAAPLDQELEAQQSLGLYCEAVATLSPNCRQVFLLRKVHGLSHKEIGERMSLSISSVEKYLREGILECQAYVKGREGGAMSSTRGMGGSWER